MLDLFSIINSYKKLISRWAWPCLLAPWSQLCNLGASPGDPQGKQKASSTCRSGWWAWGWNWCLRFRCWKKFWYDIYKARKMSWKIWTSILSFQWKEGLKVLFGLRIRHWDTGHSLFVEWISLEQQNVLFDRATLQKPQSSFRDKISNIMVAWQHAFPNAENLFKIQ